MKQPATRVLVALLLGWACGCKSNPTRLVQQAVDARGGLERLRAIQTERLSGTISLGQQVGTLHVEFKRPERMRMEIGLPGGTMVRFLDGPSGWISETSANHSQVRPMSVVELEKARREADLDGPLVDSAAKGIRISLGGQGQLNGRPTEELEVFFKDGSVERYQLDAATHEPAGWAVTELIDGKETLRATSFRATERVDGVLFPTLIETAAVGGRPAQRIHIEHIELNPPLLDARFRPETRP